MQMDFKIFDFEDILGILLIIILNKNLNRYLSLKVLCRSSELQVHPFHLANYLKHV
jgi:hypothetical protein